MTKLFNYIFILNLIIFLSIKHIVAKENLVTDMSENSVEISSTFLGAKILLFGEYGLIKDSKGLSIPYNFYKGALKHSQNHSALSKESNTILQDYLQYLKTIDTNLVRFKLDQMALDISDGMYFDSSIPRGYGVGSSGALVAAIYDRYALDKVTVLENLTRDKLLKLKVIFAGNGVLFPWKVFWAGSP